MTYKKLTEWDDIAKIDREAYHFLTDGKLSEATVLYEKQFELSPDDHGQESLGIALMNSSDVKNPRYQPTADG